MSQILLGTNFVRMDEMAFSLKETYAPAPDCKSVRRYMTVKVLRGDKLVEFRKDLGPASAFTCDEFIIPGGVYDPVTGRGELLETVGRLVDIAEHVRGGPFEPEPKPAASDLIGQYKDLGDQRRRARRRQSQFGAQARIQRS